MNTSRKADGRFIVAMGVCGLQPLFRDFEEDRHMGENDREDGSS